MTQGNNDEQTLGELVGGDEELKQELEAEGGSNEEAKRNLYRKAKESGMPDAQIGKLVENLNTGDLEGAKEQVKNFVSLSQKVTFRGIEKAFAEGDVSYEEYAEARRKEGIV